LEESGACAVIQSSKQEMKVTNTAVGTSIPRLDGYEKVTGQAKYAGDLQMPGMLHARVRVSPYPHARILTIDKSAAEAIRGVIVLTASDLPIVNGDPSRQG